MLLVACRSVCLSVRLPACVFLRQSVSFLVYLPACLSISCVVRLFVSLSAVCLSVCVLVLVSVLVPMLVLVSLYVFAPVVVPVPVSGAWAWWCHVPSVLLVRCCGPCGVGIIGPACRYFFHWALNGPGFFAWGLPPGVPGEASPTQKIPGLPRISFVPYTQLHTVHKIGPAGLLK